jgi:hypothetical protein
LEGEEEIVERIEHHDHIINKNLLPRVQKLEDITNEIVASNEKTNAKMDEITRDVFDVKRTVHEQGEKNHGLLTKLLDAVLEGNGVERDYEHELKLKKEERDHELKQKRIDFFIKSLTILAGSGGILYILVDAALTK